jgi:hypothetical protein
MSGFVLNSRLWPPFNVVPYHLAVAVACLTTFAMTSEADASDVPMYLSQQSVVTLGHDVERLAAAAADEALLRTFTEARAQVHAEMRKKRRGGFFGIQGQWTAMTRADFLDQAQTEFRLTIDFRENKYTARLGRPDAEAIYTYEKELSSRTSRGVDTARERMQRNCDDLAESIRGSGSIVSSDLGGNTVNRSCRSWSNPRRRCYKAPCHIKIRKPHSECAYIFDDYFVSLANDVAHNTVPTIHVGDSPPSLEDVDCQFEDVAYLPLIEAKILCKIEAGSDGTLGWACELDGISTKTDDGSHNAMRSLHTAYTNLLESTGSTALRQLVATALNEYEQSMRPASAAPQGTPMLSCERRLPAFSQYCHRRDDISVVGTTSSLTLGDFHEAPNGLHYDFASALASPSRPPEDVSGAAEATISWADDPSCWVGHQRGGGQCPVDGNVLLRDTEPFPGTDDLSVQTLTASCGRETYATEFSQLELEWTDDTLAIVGPMIIVEPQSAGGLSTTSRIPNHCGVFVESTDAHLGTWSYESNTAVAREQELPELTRQVIARLLELGRDFGDETALSALAMAVEALSWHSEAVSAEHIEALRKIAPLAFVITELELRGSGYLDSQESIAVRIVDLIRSNPAGHRECVAFLLAELEESDSYAVAFENLEKKRAEIFAYYALTAKTEPAWDTDAEHEQLLLRAVWPYIQTDIVR